MRDEIYPVFNTVSEFTFNKILKWSPHTMDMTYYVCLILSQGEKRAFIFVTKGLENLVKALLSISYSLLCSPLIVNLGVIYLI